MSMVMGFQSRDSNLTLKEKRGLKKNHEISLSDWEIYLLFHNLWYVACLIIPMLALTKGSVYTLSSSEILAHEVIVLTKFK